MTPNQLHAEPLGDEISSQCPCCGRAVFDGEGMLLSGETELAHYGYCWSDGHASRFTIGVTALDENGESRFGLAVLSCRRDGERLSFTVLDPQESPWADSEALGRVLTKRELLEDRVLPEIFELADAIVAQEQRLVRRIARRNKKESRSAPASGR